MAIDFKVKDVMHNISQEIRDKCYFSLLTSLLEASVSKVSWKHTKKYSRTSL